MYENVRTIYKNHQTSIKTELRKAGWKGRSQLSSMSANLSWKWAVPGGSRWLVIGDKDTAKIETNKTSLAICQPKTQRTETAVHPKESAEVPNLSISWAQLLWVADRNQIWWFLPNLGHSLIELTNRLKYTTYISAYIYIFLHVYHCISYMYKHTHVLDMSILKTLSLLNLQFHCCWPKLLRRQGHLAHRQA